MAHKIRWDVVIITIGAVYGAMSGWSWFQADYDFKTETNSTIHLLEARFGGKDKIKCDPRKLKENVTPSIVRIIGSVGEGTGFAISSNEIMTSYHVVENEPSPKIVYPDSTIELPAAMRGDKEMDIAIITVNQTLKPLEFTNPAEPLMHFGEPVYSIGYPNGSAMPGDPLISQGWFEGTRDVPDWASVSLVEAGMTIVKGMSGGPLVDSCGNVIGINMMTQPGLSMFASSMEVMDQQDKLANMDVGNITVDPFTAEGVVKGFYELMNAERWEEAYNLLHPNRRTLPLTQWIEGYKQTLHTNVIKAEANGSKVNVKIRANDWVDGYLVAKHFEGTWTVSFAGDVYNLVESNIKEVEPAGYSWYWE